VHVYSITEIILIQSRSINLSGYTDENQGVLLSCRICFVVNL